ncbi:UPF0016-domain-containing protein [Sodiomyces alkalinus F11]|uniref:UPF0016-domain-containing protein n=1 Tax=Sodiomyces alkalinus (strain CBS 110278 / VKM F-3762 / F11) TaxID=1314773 RepID=A0A3N2PT37_SODAK|nr:UPF0016-domain-containing protein [Sodiomyces alkalinus F11]ROT37648.1 UPF0016-domain-containing protein [Sodiomyces alkalinus F11]
MRLRTQPSSLFLFLVPSLVAVLAIDPSSSTESRIRTIPEPADSSFNSILKRQLAAGGTRDAPVDGNDGMPHQGPFVDSHKSRDEDDAQTDVLEENPDDIVLLDGRPVLEPHDGVMDDPDRPKPREGTTGTEGGVSEKEKERKAQGGRTGDTFDNTPESPKEVPPSPQSEEETILNHSGHDDDHDDDTTADEVAGLQKPAHLSDTSSDEPPPIPDSAIKDHLSVSEPYIPVTAPGGDEVDEGIIQPFHSYILSLTMILVSEVGDKTFLVAALMAMKHDRMVVFSAAFSALLVMTVLSAVLGHAVPTLIPQRLTAFAAAGLFFVFGVRLFREGLAMDPNEGVTEELHEVERELAEKEKEAVLMGAGRHRSDSASVSPHALEMGLGNGLGNGHGRGHGHTGRQSRSQNRFPTPPRSPSSSPSRSPSRTRYGPSLTGALQGLSNLVSLLLSPAWVQTFVMTFLGEWGDRSQIATIAMAAGQDYWWVTLGAMTGHGICTGVAVIGGRAIAGRVSLKVGR